MIQFAKLDDYFDHDMEDIKSFLNIVIDDWQKLRADILEATTTANEKKYSDTTHKMISVLRLIEAVELENALQKLRTTFTNNNRVAMQQQTPKTLAIFDQVVADMRQHIAE